ncbi:PspC domain-containing protein [Rubritalea marina]|uniref:PspC domain-containing protein n=1 Tax=Rubritalea marina TaxID=361055 RepID=UPI0014616B51|nr:PspC domain-containing protein [Rubritalea marina]
MNASKDKPMIGGVCYTLNKKLLSEIPTWGWRLIFVCSVLLYGFGVLPYLLLWIFMPKVK